MGNTLTCPYCHDDYICDGGTDQRDYNHILDRGKCYTKCRDKKVPDIRNQSHINSTVNEDTTLYRYKVKKKDTNEPHILFVAFNPNKELEAFVTLTNSVEETIFQDMLYGEGCVGDFIDKWKLVKP